MGRSDPQTSRLNVWAPLFRSAARAVPFAVRTSPHVACSARRRKRYGSRPLAPGSRVRLIAGSALRILSRRGMEVASGAGVLTVRASTQFWRELPSAESSRPSYRGSHNAKPCLALTCKHQFVSAPRCVCCRGRPSHRARSVAALRYRARDSSPLQNAERLRPYERVNESETVGARSLCALRTF